MGPDRVITWRPITWTTPIPPDWTNPLGTTPQTYGPLSAYPVSLLPNLATYDTILGTATSRYFDLGGMDESWDAPDLQNMFLAMVPPRAAESVYNGTPLPIIPSFHRPELINFWLAQLISSGDPPEPRGQFALPCNSARPKRSAISSARSSSARCHGTIPISRAAIRISRQPIRYRCLTNLINA